MTGDLFPPSLSGGEVEEGEGEEEEGEEEFSLSRIKAELGFADDAEGTYVGLPSASSSSAAAAAAAGEGGRMV